MQPERGIGKVLYYIFFPIFMPLYMLVYSDDTRNFVLKWAAIIALFLIAFLSGWHVMNCASKDQYCSGYCGDNNFEIEDGECKCFKVVYTGKRKGE